MPPAHSGQPPRPHPALDVAGEHRPCYHRDVRSNPCPSVMSHVGAVSFPHLENRGRGVMVKTKINICHVQSTWPLYKLVNMKPLPCLIHQECPIQ